MFYVLKIAFCHCKDSKRYIHNFVNLSVLLAIDEVGYFQEFSVICISFQIRLFDGISNFVSNLIPKSSLSKYNWGKRGLIPSPRVLDWNWMP